jgi:hypothetical protein
MKDCLILLLALTASIGATGAANDTQLPASVPVASASSRDVLTEAGTSRTDGFLKLLRDQLDIKPAERFAAVSKLIDWERLRQEAGNTTEPAVKTERLAYVECWKRLAEAYDFGTMCSRPNVFEGTACALLAGKHKADNRLPYADLGIPKEAACEYLLAEDLPTWATSLRLCAAGVLAGDGNQRGLEVLLEALRADLKKPGVFSPIREALGATWTAEALPLWAKAANDIDPRLRLTVVRQLAQIRTDGATTVLRGLLKDDDREVRTAAAMALMDRDSKDAAPVLLEKVNRELDGKVSSAHANAPICRKLQQWNRPDVPWEKLETILTDKVHANDTEYWQAVEVAGGCLAAGREKVALPFLKTALHGGVEKRRIAWHATTILAANGRLEGVDAIRTYMEVGEQDWIMAQEGLLALAAFVNRPGARPNDRQLALAIAARAFERRDALFQGYVGRGLEVLGEIGALVRVERRAGQPVAVDTLTVPYDQRYGPQPRYLVAEIYRAKLRSVAAAARQEGIPLPPGWLAEYEKAERAVIVGLARGPAEPNGPPADADRQRAAAAALKELGIGSPIRCVSLNVRTPGGWMADTWIYSGGKRTGGPTPFHHMEEKPLADPVALSHVIAQAEKVFRSAVPSRPEIKTNELVYIQIETFDRETKTYQRPRQGQFEDAGLVELDKLLHQHRIGAW